MADFRINILRFADLCGNLKRRYHYICGIDTWAYINAFDRDFISDWSDSSFESDSDSDSIM